MTSSSWFLSDALEELDESADLWVIPGNRMKTGHEHLVPLTDPLKELLDSLKFTGDEEFVFASPWSGGLPSISSINQHFIRMGYKGVQTAHGLRRTALTLVGRSGFLCGNHSTSDGTRCGRQSKAGV